MRWKGKHLSIIFDVLDELIPLFPDGYFHLGGDEVVKMRWQLCPHCQAFMKKTGLKDEEELQQFFMSRVSRYLKEKGVASMMWNWDSVEATQCSTAISYGRCVACRKTPRQKSQRPPHGKLRIFPLLS